MKKIYKKKIVKNIKKKPKIKHKKNNKINFLNVVLNNYRK